MDSHTVDHILRVTGAEKITKTELLQELWNGYGQLLRVYLSGYAHDSVILKHIVLPEEASHPNGFNTDLSKRRKIKSYQVETTWYEEFNSVNLKDSFSLTPKKIDCFQRGSEYFILLQDLNSIGCTEKITEPSFDDVKRGLAWLASFHAKFLNQNLKGLWGCGTYWHLDTRPDELERLFHEDPDLWRFSGLIDKKLSGTNYQTIVHGDAKLDNFCFSSDRHIVAAVDFQYVGKGCGIKDVAYFIGSCLREDDSCKYEEKILTYYFSELSKRLKGTDIDFKQLEHQWRALYIYAWADFHRFLKGWNPKHWKINSYSESVSRKVQKNISVDLLAVAQEACVEAGKLIKEKWKKNVKVTSKSGSSEASRALTEIDLQSQSIISSKLAPSLKEYDLGWLSEETRDDGSRFEKDYFWVVDPLDGTLPFSEGLSGFAVSVALVSRQGQTLIGAVYDPVAGDFYHAIKTKGSFKNHKPFIPEKNSETVQFFSDRSLKKSSNYSDLENTFTIHCIGGAVINSINVLENKNSCYFKYPKKETGGCAIWDLAAVALILEEAGGVVTDFKGNPLLFNSRSSLHFNECGFIFASCKEVHQKIRKFHESTDGGFET